MKISFLGNGFLAWGGGVDFLKYVSGSMAMADEANAISKQIILPLSTDADERTRDYFRGYFAHAQFELTFTGPSYPDQLAAAADFAADVVMPCMYLPPIEIDRPWVGYLYDFQHKHYPAFFSEEDRQIRDQSFHGMLHRPKHVIANSRAVVEDARRFYGDFPAQAHALPFAPSPEPEWLKTGEDVRSKYGIDRPYFMVCNQFWKHKDHPTAFLAFARFLRDGGDALLICTGEITDYRFPDYFARLQSFLALMGLNDRVRILGRIPKDDQISLVKRALAMVQPTLFEGGPGGGSVYDAIAVGTPAIVSDIPVNREVEGREVTFFPAGDNQALAAALGERFQSPAKRPSAAILQKEALKRRHALGETLIGVAKMAAG